MPKTQINYERKWNADAEAPVTTKPDGSVEPTVHVNWLNSAEGAGHVQVMFEVPEHYLKLALDSPNGEAPGTSQVWSPVLDRAEINRMVRALRTARDKAYGRDE